MPMPAVEDAMHLVRRRRCLARCSQSNTGGRGQRDAIAAGPARRRAASAARSATSPPPVMCAMPLTRTALHQREHRLHVDARRREQRVAERRIGSRVEAVRARSAPRASTMRRISEKPFECGPLDARPIRRSPGAMARPSMIALFSTTPTAKPARSYAPRGTCPDARPSRRRSARSRRARNPRRCP